jgi:ankyrin repeat protein
MAADAFVHGRQRGNVRRRRRRSLRVHFKPQDGTTALMFAAQRGHAECVRILLQSGANKEAKNQVRLIDTVLFKLPTFL